MIKAYETGITMPPACVIDEPFISVIVPVFNTEKYLPLLIQSLKSQVYTDFEVWFVDDGSTDGSARLIEAEAEKDARFKIHKQLNSGISAARNAGLKLAKGDWIVFVDSDDYLPGDSFSSIAAAVKNVSVDVLVTNAFQFIEQPEQIIDARILKQQPWGARISGSDWIVHTVRSKNWKHYVWSHCYRKEFLKEHNFQFPAALVHEDVLWCCHIGLKAEHVLFMDVITYGYRMNPASVSNAKDSTSTFNRIKSYKTVILELIAIGSGIENSKLKNSVYKQALIEAGHLTGLLRKRFTPTPESAMVAKELLESPSLKILFRSVLTPSDAWKVFRLYKILRVHRSAYK